MKIVKGFTLLELMLALAIVGVLSAIAVPTYINYLKKGKVSELVSVASGLKPIVAECLLYQNNPNNCKQNQNGIPPTDTTTHGVVSNSTVKQGGVISITGTSEVDSAIYELVPTITSSGLITFAVKSNKCAYFGKDCSAISGGGGGGS